MNDLLDPNSMFPNLKKVKFDKKGKKSFVGILQTSDILGYPDNKIGNADVLSNGGRLQPGCYKDSNNIKECK